jgi:hypothetical protein
MIQSERDAMPYIAHPYLMAHGPDTDNGNYLKAEMGFCGFSASTEWKQEYNAVRNDMTLRRKN